MADLRHVGILGMKWGRRKPPNGGSGSRSSDRTSSDHRVGAALKKKKLKEMTNEELTTLTKRLQLEKQYKELTKSDISAGQKFISEVIQSAGKQLASKYVASIGDDAIKSVWSLINKKD